MTVDNTLISLLDGLVHDNMGVLKTTHTIMTISTAKKSVNISQSNELTEAAYYLPLQAKRVLWLCLIQCYQLKDDTDSVSPVFTVLVAGYQKYFKESVDTASSDVKKGAENGKLKIEFNYKVMPYLIGLTSQFTPYSLYDCGIINSVRVIRLYESLCQYHSSGVWVTTPEWLSERFMLPNVIESPYPEV